MENCRLCSTKLINQFISAIVDSQVSTIIILEFIKVTGEAVDIINIHQLLHSPKTEQIPTKTEETTSRGRGFGRSGSSSRGRSSNYMRKNDQGWINVTNSKLRTNKPTIHSRDR